MYKLRYFGIIYIVFGCFFDIGVTDALEPDFLLQTKCQAINVGNINSYLIYGFWNLNPDKLTLKATYCDC